MEQLLSIKSIPIKVEVKVQRGELKLVEDSVKSSAAAPAVKVSSKKDGGLRLQAEPYRMDFSEARNYDAYIPSGGSENGITLTYEAIAKIADGGNSAGVKKLSGDEQKLHATKASRSIESILQSLPRNGAVSYADGTLSINYHMQPTSAGSDIPDPADMLGSHKFEFVPGSIEFIISQMPEVDIEYLGDPIYFPRSADPNYEPPLDVFA